ncbi:MAG TPA: inositol monophosphatase family protein, partial [Gemmatimonadales bacterium]|nr:inositol monophosphatase family protein [Gemmatimonadales bacterium]
MSVLDLLHVAKAAAGRAAGYLRQVQRPSDPSGWALKGARDFVTDVDRTAERMIWDALLAWDSTARVVGEELHPELVTEGLVWIVDPLDGTTNFLHGFPAYAVSIGAQLDGELVAGVIHDVQRDLVHHAALGHGAWTGDAHIRVS